MASLAPMLFSFFLAQAGAGWVGPTAALSLVIIAIAIVVALVTVILALRRAGEASHAAAEELASLRAELHPTLESIQQLGKAGEGLANRVQDEVGEVIRTSQRVRFEVDRGLRRAKTRLAEFDAVTEVVQEEIEDTALDVAATLRTLRRGRGVIGRIRRLLRGRR